RVDGLIRPRDECGGDADREECGEQGIADQPPKLRDGGTDREVRRRGFPGQFGDLGGFIGADRDRDADAHLGADGGGADRDDLGRDQVSERDRATDIGGRRVIPGETQCDVDSEWNWRCAGWSKHLWPGSIERCGAQWDAGRKWDQRHATGSSRAAQFLKLRSEVKGFEQGGLSRYLLSK